MGGERGVIDGGGEMVNEEVLWGVVVSLRLESI